MEVWMLPLVFLPVWVMLMFMLMCDDDDDR